MIVYKSKITGKWVYLDKQQFEMIILAVIIAVQTILICRFVWLPYMLSDAIPVAKIVQTFLTAIVIFFIGVLNWYAVSFSSYVFDLIKNKIKGDKSGSK